MMTLIANFNMQGIPWFMENLVKDEFVALYSRFASTSADFYAVKNEEFDRLYENDSTLNYDRWMSGEMRKVVSGYRSLLIDLDVDDDCDIYGKFKYGDGTIRMYLTEA